MVNLLKMVCPGLISLIELIILMKIYIRLSVWMI